MTEQLFQIGNTQFWVLADVEAEKILETYKRSQVIADIQAIQNTLAQYPDPTVMQQDLQDVIWLVDNFAGATKARKDRVKTMLQNMWEAYQDEPLLFEQAELRNKLERLQAILARMV